MPLKTSSLWFDSFIGENVWTTKFYRHALHIITTGGAPAKVRLVLKIIINNIYVFKPKKILHIMYVQ